MNCLFFFLSIFHSLTHTHICRHTYSNHCILPSDSSFHVGRASHTRICHCPLVFGCHCMVFHRLPPSSQTDSSDTLGCQQSCRIDLVRCSHQYSLVTHTPYLSTPLHKHTLLLPDYRCPDQCSLCHILGSQEAHSNFLCLH